jgi:hypothetical protein
MVACVLVLVGGFVAASGEAKSPPVPGKGEPRTYDATEIRAAVKRLGTLDDEIEWRDRTVSIREKIEQMASANAREVFLAAIDELEVIPWANVDWVGEKISGYDFGEEKEWIEKMCHYQHVWDCLTVAQGLANREYRVMCTENRVFVEEPDQNDFRKGKMEPFFKIWASRSETYLAPLGVQRQIIEAWRDAARTMDLSKIVCREKFMLAGMGMEGELDIVEIPHRSSSGTKQKGR